MRYAATKKVQSRKRWNRKILAAAAATVLFVVSLLWYHSSTSAYADRAGESYNNNNSNDSHRCSVAYGKEKSEKSDGDVLPEGISTTPPTLGVAPPNWVNPHDRIVYYTPHKIPVDTMRQLLDPAFIKNIKRPRRVYDSQRFPKVDEEMNRLLDLSLLVRDVAAAAAEKVKKKKNSSNVSVAVVVSEKRTGLQDAAYTVSKAKALLSSLRGTLSDAVDDRVEALHNEGLLSHAQPPPSLARFVLLELADTQQPTTASYSSVSAGMGGDVLLLPLLRDALNRYGFLRVMSVSTGNNGNVNNKSGEEEKRPDGGGGNAFWVPYARSDAAAAALGERNPTGRFTITATPTTNRTQSAASTAASFFCYTNTIADNNASASSLSERPPTPESVVAVAAGLTWWLKRQTGGDEAIAWSHVSGVASPIHEALRIRALGATGGGDEVQKAADRLQERKLAQVIHGDRRSETCHHKTEGLVGPRVIAQLAAAMRPMVDIQILSSFTALYDALVQEEERRRRRWAADGEGAARAGDVDNGATEEPFRSHFLIGGHSVLDGQAEFEAFLVFLVANAKEATYLELPNLFACQDTGRGWAEEAETQTERQAAAARSGKVSPTAFRLAKKLLQWYVKPLLRGRTAREKGADGMFNPNFIIGLGEHAAPESKNRRVMSMANLFEAILASYGVFSEMSIIVEESLMEFCTFGSTDATAATAEVKSLQQLRWRNETGRTFPRIVIRYSPDRLQLMAARKKQPLLERLDCASLPA